VAQNWDRDRLDTARRGIRLRIVPKLVLETNIDGAVAVYTRVRGPHEGKRLAHMTEGGRYGAMPDGFTTGGDATVSYSGSKDLEEMDGVGDVAKGGVLTKGAAEGSPNVPGFIAPITVLSSEAGAGRCLCSADISEE
jgi:hypothetical protein